MTDPTDSMQMRRAELQLLRTLPELLTHHLEHRPQIPVYMQYDNRVKQWQTLTVQDTYERVMRWAHAFAALGLKRGERVAMLLPNGIDAICFDMAALHVRSCACASACHRYRRILRFHPARLGRTLPCYDKIQSLA